MKKFLIVGFAALMLVACSYNKTTTEIRDVPKQENESKEITNQEVKSDVMEKVFYKWNDESIGGMEQIVTYAVIKNTGKVDADITQTKITYLDSKGDVIGNTTANAMYTNLSPSILKPGDIAYLAINDDSGEEFNDLKDVTVEVSPLPYELGVNKLESTNSKVIKKVFDSEGSVNVTGFLHNKGDVDATAIEAAAGLYDKNDKFLGAVLLSSDDTTTVNAGKKSSIDLGIPSFPFEQIKNVDHAEIKAISY